MVKTLATSKIDGFTDFIRGIFCACLGAKAKEPNSEEIQMMQLEEFEVSNYITAGHCMRIGPNAVNQFTLVRCNYKVAYCSMVLGWIEFWTGNQNLMHACMCESIVDVSNTSVLNRQHIEYQTYMYINQTTFVRCPDKGRVFQGPGTQCAES